MLATETPQDSVNAARPRPGKTVEITAPFQIGRYPVTNGQYQAFIDDSGYRERRWWSEIGWA